MCITHPAAIGLPPPTKTVGLWSILLPPAIRFSLLNCTFQGLEEPGRVAWSPKGDWLVSCGEDGRVNCVAYPKGKQQILVAGHRQSGLVRWLVSGQPMDRRGRRRGTRVDLVHKFPRAHFRHRKNRYWAKTHVRIAPNLRRHQKGAVTENFALFTWLHKKSEESDSG